MYEDQDLAKRTEELVEENRDILDDQFAFRAKQYDAGLAMVHFPEEYGGLDGNRGQQAVIDSVLRSHGVNYEDLRINPIGIGMGAPTVLAYGSDELKQKHMRKIFTGEDVWCQLFSEPTHGSDVAGIPSRAVRDGDEWVVNGQKVWTTLAHTSNFGMLLTRTNPDVPKHKGLSYFVLDMHAPGVDVRPLYQMTGEAEFNEVFLTDVRIHDSLRLGDEGDGWRVAITTLMNERVALAGGPAPRGSGPINELMKLWAVRKSQLSPVEHEIWRDRVMSLWIDAEIVRLTNARAKQSAVGGNPGPEGSVGKLASAEFSKRVASAIVDLEGAAGMLHEPGYPMTRSSGAMQTRSGRFLRSRANTIEGGTSEIMRNILGERVLGLPGDVRVDSDVPWTDIPK
ncbi:MAG: acyl-CoA dehydrogenase family protein [Acidimicrobiia bacterium]|nr:acyl-CoA dehydrogenase family protein [Acidimicrobiia bacterium]